MVTRGVAVPAAGVLPLLLTPNLWKMGSLHRGARLQTMTWKRGALRALRMGAKSTAPMTTAVLNS
eukprot:5602396-Prorocentrum_lima.AAC.1